MKEFGSVIYMDSSIRFKSGDLKPLLETLKTTGMLTQFIGLKLTSYTDPQMFEWFGETSEAYKGFFTIEANIFMFTNNFLTSIMMRAWIACALVCIFLFFSDVNSNIVTCKLNYVVHT